MAISGAIIPEPLAIPLICTVLPLISNEIVEPFEKVSVVIIALAASSSASLRKDVDNAAIHLIILWSGRTSPMTPVEEVKTALVGRLRLAATDEQIRSTDACPAVPVKALALPEFTSIAAPCGISPFSLV